MSIAAKTKPEVVVLGTVARTQDKAKKDTGEVFGGLILVDTPSGGVWLSSWVNDLPVLPAIGQYIAVFAVVEEDPKYGGGLTYSRDLLPGDLDRIASAIAKGK